jgi:hypothetical protein
LQQADLDHDRSWALTAFRTAAVPAPLCEGALDPFDRGDSEATDSDASGDRQDVIAGLAALGVLAALMNASALLR